MKALVNLQNIINKTLITFMNLKKTAYHHYGNQPTSLFKFIYFSMFRINTFYVFRNDLSRELPPHNLDAYYTVVKPSLDELEDIRNGMDLPREFYYDQIYNARTCYLTFKDGELAYIHWVLFKGDYNRFLILGDDTAELNYNTTLPKFRGNKLMAKMMAYICEDLKEAGYSKAIGVIHELNPPAIKAIESAGFRKVGKIKSLGPLNRKMRV